MGSYSVNLSAIEESLGFDIIYKASDYDRLEIDTFNLNRPGLQLAGYFDYFDSTRIQLMGKMEDAYLNSLSTEERRLRFEKLLSMKIPAIVLCHEVEAKPECVETAREMDVTVFSSKMDTSAVLASLIAFLREQLAPRVTRSGVCVEVYGEGMLILGESGVGKSEAALELIKRGHRLIADDAVEIRRVAPKTLVASAPELIRYYMELRGVGIIDVRRTFGSGAVKDSEKIDLVVMLEDWKDNATYDRLGAEEKIIEILGIRLPFLTIPIKPGRNVAVILEIAAMNNRQKKMGYHSAKEFSERINKHFDDLERK